MATSSKERRILQHLKSLNVIQIPDADRDINNNIYTDETKLNK